MHLFMNRVKHIKMGWLRVRLLNTESLFLDDECTEDSHVKNERTITLEHADLS